MNYVIKIITFAVLAFATTTAAWAEKPHVNIPYVQLNVSETTVNNGDTYSFTADETYDPAVDITVKSDIPVWVSFNSNGGWGSMQNQAFTRGVPAPLTANAFTREGYYFTHWNTLSNGSGRSYSDQQEITLNIPITLYAQWAPIDFYQNGSTYTINTAEGWNQFCNALQDTATYHRFSGKTVKLGANISVTSMAGSSGHDFMGTFDGQGHTLTVNYNTSEQYAAPFRNVENGCVIENLIVEGTITTSAMNAAGIVGNQYGTVIIRNCRSSVTIQSSVNGDGTHGGFVGNKGSSNTSGLYIEGCVFDGKIVSTGTSATTDCGGFVGWKGDRGLLSITNSLYAPTADPSAVSVGATFARNWTMSDGANYFYTTTLGTAQGKAARSITADDNSTTVAFAGFPTATYSVSGITAYSVGLVYGGILYAGLGDQVSLTVSSTASTPEPGYQYAFTASAGTVDGTTLTMPDEDVVVSINTENAFPVDWATVNRGTQVDPYMIYNEEQLLLLAHRVNGTSDETSNDYHDKYFKLGADIAFPYDEEERDDYEENYEAIGGYHGNRTYDFCGDFDGDNKTVSGIRIRKTGQNLDASNQGLFGNIGAGANIHDVHLTNARITGLNAIGGIVGRITEQAATAIVSGCSVTESEFTMGAPFGCGVICGLNSGNGTLSNNYYYNCYVESQSSNIGCNGADITDNQGALPAYYLDLGEGVTILTPMAADLGFSYDSDDNGEDENYWRRGAEVTLGYSGTVPEGYALQYSTTAGTINGSTLTVSDGAFVSANFIEIIPYIDADGNTAYCSDYTTLTEAYLGSRNDVNLTAGAWYVVKDNLSVTVFSNNFTVSGSGAANIILCDGKEFEFRCTYDGYIDGSLNIYGQSAGTGRFNFNNNDPANITNKTELIVGNLTIYGGQVVLVGRDDGEETYNQRAIVGDVTIYRGSLYAKGGDNAGRDAIDGNVTFRGGSLTAFGGSRECETCPVGVGIDGNVSLDWSNAGNTFYASSYTYSPFTIADGKFFADEDGNYYSGTLTNEEKDAIGGKRLTSLTSIQLAEEQNVWHAIASPMMDNADGTLAVTTGLNHADLAAYDLYSYDEASATWVNQKAHSDFALAPGHGYILRHSGAATPTLTSERAEGNVHVGSCTVTLTSTAASGDLKGFNLVGNPFPHSIPCARPYYSLNADGTWTAHTAGGTLAVGQAILVHTDYNGEPLTITPAGIAANGAKSLPPLPKRMQLSVVDDGDDGHDGFDGQFAYCDGGQMVITQPGHLEAFDALGRRLFVRELDSFPNSLPTTLFPSAGAYLLRLDGKTQKIVIR